MSSSSTSSLTFDVINSPNTSSAKGSSGKSSVDHDASPLPQISGLGGALSSGLAGELLSPSCSGRFGDASSGELHASEGAADLGGAPPPAGAAATLKPTAADAALETQMQTNTTPRPGTTPTPTTVEQYGWLSLTLTADDEVYTPVDFALNVSTFVVGSSTEANLQIDLPRISASHCEVRLEGSRVMLVNTSMTGTYVNHFETHQVRRAVLGAQFSARNSHTPNPSRYRSSWSRATR
jgi:hypothetical protein